MADLFQHGAIATLHNLTDRPTEALEADLLKFSKQRPLGLILPTLFSELESDALQHIVEELRQVPYLSEIIIGLDCANAEQWRYAHQYFSKLPQHHRILWHDGPRLQALDQELAVQELAPLARGKGRNVWYCLGYMMASQRSGAIALHDCDITTYDRSMLARLLYPVANPQFDYRFCKGYYARVSENQLKGRVTRLLVTPLLRALKLTLGTTDYLDFLDSFRYPLSGEFALRTLIVPGLRIPSDWGLEIGILSEIQRNHAHHRVCQSEILDIYDHKHKELSGGDRAAGLSKMSMDITKALFRKLAIHGHILTKETFRTIKATYYRTALDLVAVYQNDALINALDFDRHAEERAVEVFAECIMEAGDVYMSNPKETPFIHCWERIQSAFPDFLTRFTKAVELDNMETEL
ncbi:Glucosyl-3-phosphoglycerate synthase [Acaryochloris thomasi RCC1774]|uniref:Glucosyl-3-phosphoglycerate synthase n=1 Tax=Acaryochloris thomasi RCC1774 TaxID=1764569 RepID=A0A2W1K3V2_9CYAN|nr:glycosyl transferase [Acaryochloris thomasi]PZD74577.1 Glucosyl-3-phosphoglycerate synthase [Acaryochloris thomasi RCC1774]